jgi:hypothetical protein
MADIRIKDLTTTASTTAADDFFAADGATNGTRKLSAYSPSFGGNATVGGTLTVSGSGTTAIGGMIKGAAATYSGFPPAGVTSAFQVDVENATTRDVLSFGDSSRAGLLRGAHDGSGRVTWSFGRYAAGAFAEYARLEGVASADAKLTINGTTASTSTSSGVLVVSGGVGVAKEVYVGTTLKLANTSQSVTAWGDIGAQFSVAGAVITDTSSSGTVSRAVVNSIAASALAASSTTTYTQAASLFVAGAPTANTNVTITNAYAIYTAGGRINFQGLPTSSAGLQAGTLWNDGGTLKIA